MFREFMDCAADFSERHDIPMEFWRNDVGDWHLTMKFKDAKGWYSAMMEISAAALKKSKAETEEAWCDKTRISLSKVVQKAREDRIKQLTRRVNLAARAA